MKPIILIPCIAMSLSQSLPAASLPDPLTARDGTTIESAEQWTNERRPELLELFRHHVYGHAPVNRPENLRFEVVEDGVSAFNGKALRREIKMSFDGPRGSLEAIARFYFPTNQESPRGCYLLIMHRGPEFISAAEEDPTEVWPVEEIVNRGYVTASFHNAQFAPDDREQQNRTGVFALYEEPAPPRAFNAWGSIAAWAWGASRVIDYIKQEPLLKELPLAVAGHSRGGKAALWCGAQDTRVDLTISNNSGSTGAALARTTTGETVRMINSRFPHWFPANYQRFNDNHEAMPVDQHMLIALMAPRRVYVASGSEDAHACPEAEFQACVEATPVFQLFGLDGMSTATYPEPETAFHTGSIAYHLRPGRHGLNLYDWERFMNYTDLHWGPSE